MRYIHLKTALFSCLFMAICLGYLQATMTNEGNEAVDVAITGKNGSSRRITIYPGQSIATSENTDRVEMISRTTRGDEIMKLKVDQGSGEPIYLEEPGAVFIFGQEPEEKEPAKILPKVENAGNVVLKLRLTKSNGASSLIDILPTQTITLSHNVVELKIESKYSPPRGDETIMVKVTLPNGESQTFYSVGSKINFDDAQKKEGVPQLEIPAILPGGGETAASSKANTSAEKTETAS